VDRKLEFEVNAIAVIGKDLWFAGNDRAAVFRANETGVWTLVNYFQYPGEAANPSVDGNGHEIKWLPLGMVHWILADKTGAALLIGMDGQVYRWNGNADVLTSGALDIDNEAVDQAAAAAALREPTMKQIQEIIQLFQKVPQDQLGDLEAAAKEKQAAEHWNNRQRLEWTIQEFKRLIATNATAPAPTTRPGDGMFKNSIEGLRFFSPTTGAAVTEEGILTTDGSLDRWKGVAGWDKKYGVFLVGGTENCLFLVTTEVKDVVAPAVSATQPANSGNASAQREVRQGKKVLVRREATFKLWRWTHDGGLTEIRTLPIGDRRWLLPAVCAFANERVGVFADGNNLMATLDGARTWTRTPLSLDEGEQDIGEIEFCGDRDVAIPVGRESVAMFHLDDQGRAHEVWRSQFIREISASPRNPPIRYDARHNLLWVYSDGHNGASDRLQALDPKNGNVIKEFQPYVSPEYFGSFSVTDGRMFTLGSGFGGAQLLRIWNLDGVKPLQVSQIGVENGGHGISAAMGVPGSDDVYLVLDHWQLVRWDGKPMIPFYLTSSLKRPSVDTTILDAAEDNWAPGDQPSRRELAANADAREGLTREQSSQLGSDLEKMLDQFDNNRDQTNWETNRALEIRARATTAPTTEPAGE
jgi:hypothetical protein